MEIVVFLMAERIKAPHRKAGIFQRQRQRWQVRLGTKKGNSFLMEEKWGHPISLQSLLLVGTFLKQKCCLVGQRCRINSKPHEVLHKMLKS